MVRVLGTVTGAHGMQVRVGTDHDGVTVNGIALGPAQQEEFAQLFVSACHEAAVNAERMRLDAEAVREEQLEAAEMAADRRASFDID